MKISKQTIGLIAGLVGLVLPHLIPLGSLSLEGQIALGIFLMAGVFWILEPIPIYATSMVVILLQVFLLSNKGITLGLLGDYKPQAYTEFYGTLASPIIILFLGGFSLAAAAVKYGLDRSLAKVLLKPFGSKPQNVCLGLMVSTAVLSAFMSNTATTAMMITVVLPIIAQLDKADPFRKVVALSIPVGANIGGIATPIGTPPNAIAISALREQGIEIAFSTWMILALPAVVIMLLVAWRLLIWLFPPTAKRFDLNLEGGGKKSPAAIGTYILFGVTVLLWVTEKLHGISSSVIAFIPIACLPALGILDKKDIRGFSWEVLWLVAGGISLGLSLKDTGLASWMINLIQWESLPSLLLIFLFCVVGLCVANLISNTVSATILVPLVIGLAETGAQGSFNMGVLVITVGVVVSFSMSLPISTPPNAIAMSTGMIETKDMAKTGLLVGACALVVVMLSALFYWPLILQS